MGTLKQAIERMSVEIRLFVMTNYEAGAQNIAVQNM